MEQRQQIEVVANGGRETGNLGHFGAGKAKAGMVCVFPEEMHL